MICKKYDELLEVEMKVKFKCEECGSKYYYERLNPREARLYKRIKKGKHRFKCSECSGLYNILGWNY